MADNDKGELIKKKDSNANKKTVVIKKSNKKVIIKKHIKKHNEQKNINKSKETNESKNSNNNSKKKVIKKFNNSTNKTKNTLNNNKKFVKKSNIESPIGNKPSEKDNRTRKKYIDKKKQNANKIVKKSKESELQKVYLHKKTKEEKQLESVPNKIDIMDVISISDLAKKMNLKAKVIISKLFELGTMTTINDKIDAETAEIVCSEFNCSVNVVSLYDETVIKEEEVDESDIRKRPPVVTVMGHVDHGKTKLLDAIRKSDVVSGESGGITQHIGAYSVTIENGSRITFIDTPGHQAFTMMRARGAQVTDIVILVVAADDGVMPQTIEAIQHAKVANVPVIVAVNKIDREGANIEKTKQQLSDYDLLPEEWGGQTLYCEVSALKKIGIDSLLETIILQADMLDLKVSYKMRPIGYIIESKIDKGRGVVASVLVQKGTLHIGDFFVAGIYYGKVRAMYNDKGERVKEAGPSTPVEITGIENVPKAGDPFNVTKTEKEAKLIAYKRQELNRIEESKSVKKVTLQDLLSRTSEGEVQELKVIIKADVQGSVEAIKDSLEKLSNKEVKLVTVYNGVGGINESDVMLAVASNAFIIGFHVRANMKAQELAEKEKINIKRYNIIYDVIEDIKASMEGLIKPELSEELLGSLEVLKTFKISSIGTIAGCMVSKGKVKRNSLIRLIRDDIVIYSGKISTLKRFKDEVSEVLEGTECGIAIEKYNNVKIGDTMEAYEIKEISRTLDDVAKEENKKEEK